MLLYRVVRIDRGTKSLNLESTPIDLDIFEQIELRCGFQERYSFKITPKNCILSTFSMTLPSIMRFDRFD